MMSNNRYPAKGRKVVRPSRAITVSRAATAQVIVSLMVGANRPRVLTPYAYTVPHLYEETLRFVERALGGRANAQE